MKTTRRGSALGAVVIAALLCAGCPDGVSSTSDSGAESPADVVEDLLRSDLADAVEEPDVGDVRDAAIDTRDTGEPMDAPNADAESPDAGPDASPMEAGMDGGVPGCIPGMSVACACEDGRMGAQVCRADGTFGACRCASADAATDAAPDVMLPPLGPRLITPQSVSRVTSRRPTMRWVLPAGVTRARVELCGDRACTRMILQQEVTGTSWRPTAMLAPGVVFWRVRGLASDGSVAWTSATWEYLVGHRDAPTDTSFGTLKDFNNDGYDDAASTGNYGPSGAHVSMIHGRSEQGAQVPNYELPVEHDSKLITGDFNGDGIADLVVPDGRLGIGSSAPPGTVKVFYGSSGRFSTEPGWQFNVRPTLPDHRYWYFEVASGDFDGDGFGDLAMMDGGLDEPTGAQILRIFRGGPSGLQSTPGRSQRVPDGFTYNWRPMDALVGTGDINQDGYADLLATYGTQDSLDPGLRDVGRAWVIAGGPSFPSTQWLSIEPPTRDLGFGHVAAAIGDVNGDQCSDFAISSDHVVSVYVGASGSVPTRPLRTLASPSGQCYFRGASFGAALGSAGDFNGDGRADLSVGAYCLPYLGGLRPGVGSAFIFDGATDGIVAAPTILTGMYSDSWFGYSVGGFGDFNADGLDDFFVLEPGEVSIGGMLRPPPLWIFLGSTTGIRPGTTRWTFHELSGRQFASPVATHAQRPASTRGV